MLKTPVTTAVSCLSLFSPVSPGQLHCGLVGGVDSCHLWIMQRVSRLRRELKLLATEPPPGITCWQETDQMDHLRARGYPHACDRAWPPRRALKSEHCPSAAPAIFLPKRAYVYERST